MVKFYLFNFSRTNAASVYKKMEWLNDHLMKYICSSCEVQPTKMFLRRPVVLEGRLSIQVSDLLRPLLLFHRLPSSPRPNTGALSMID